MQTKSGIQVSFTPLGFNPHTEQVCFVAVVQGARGQETFSYSGGILAFIPHTKKVRGLDGQPKEVRFDLWKTLEKVYSREPGWHTTNIQSVLRMVREGRVKAVRNLNDRGVMSVYHRIASYATPQADNLLACLYMDASADGMSFTQWCEEYGYDNDSIKAESIYRACVDTARKLQRILSREQLAELEEIAANN